MFKLSFYILLIFCASLSAGFDEDAFKSVEELVTSHGYPFELHEVQSNDYILGVHRIPHGLENQNEKGKKVVLIMHQFLTSSADFVSMGDRSLAFLLADRNYDVWLGNARGNTHSRAHNTLTPEEKKFWSFSFEEIGKEDLPAIIDYIISETGADQIYYIGHGQGSTVYFVMADSLPEYNDKVKKFAALAPMAYMENMPNPLFRILDTLLLGLDASFTIKNILAALPTLLAILNWEMNEIFPHGSQGIFPKLCDDDAMLVEVCAAFMFGVYGIDSNQLERNKVPVILSNAYAGSSFKQLQKYVDYYYNDEFGKKYDLSKTTVPTGIFYGKGDWLVSKHDVDHLIQDMGNSVKLVYEVPNSEFNHIDFMFAKDARKLVYERLFRFLEEDGETGTKIEL